MPRTNKILIRSGTAAPSASDFATNEPAFDRSAGKLYIKSAAGTMVEIGGSGGSSSVAVYSSLASFPGTGSESVLYLDESTSRLYQWESSVYVEVGGSGGGVAHASTHATGGTDAISPSAIGAAAASHTHAASDITSGTIASARLGSGTASSSTFLRGDGTWASAGSTSASDLTSGTLADARLSATAQNQIALHPFLLMGG